MVCSQALVAMCSDMLCQRSRWSSSCWSMGEHSKLADESAALNEDWLLLSGDDKVDDALSDWMF